MKYSILLSETERNALIELIDLAVRANGIQVSQAAIHITGKLNNAEQLGEDNGECDTCTTEEDPVDSPEEEE